MDFYEFAGFRLDVQKKHLTFQEKVISLTPKEFDILLFLIENRSRVVGKEEILDAVWKETFVEEATLTRNISWLRKKIAERAGETFTVIETLPKRGYRFFPEIEKNENLLIFEEETLQNIQIEEIIEIEDLSNEEKGFYNNDFLSKPKSVGVSDVKLLPEKRKTRRFSIIWLLPVFLILGLGFFIFYSSFFASKEAKTIIASQITPFSGLPGREITPSFSPDGKQIVFAWDGGIEGGNFDIYVKMIGSGNPIRLTQSESEDLNPVFSPDGKEIAFVRVFPEHCEIIAVPALGGAERKIYEKASYASISFSPDGKNLAVADLDYSQNEAGIYLLDARTGEKKRLTKPDAPAVDHTPRFSPDGKNLAFIRYFNSFKREIFVVSADGGEPRQITDDNVRIYGLTWNFDNENLFFTSFRDTNQLNLWQISTNNASEPKIISTSGKNLNYPAISPDGKTIAFVEETSDINIHEISSENKSRPIVRSSRDDHSPQFSPDGKLIVFASDRTGNYEIWIAESSGENQRQLTDMKSSAGSPRFSPDGKFIIYDVQSAGNSAIYKVSTNGETPVHVTNDDFSNFLPAWSDDGKSIFFISNRTGNNQIWKISSEGGEAVQITKQGAFEMFAANGKNEIIYSKGDGKTGLWSVGINGENEKTIPELSETGNWRSWTATSRGVFYTDFNTRPPNHIKFFDFATRQTRDFLKTDKSPLLYYSNLSVSPDEKRVFYASEDQSTSSILLGNLGN